jgi:CRP-like cAMP-binding protein
MTTPTATDPRAQIRDLLAQHCFTRGLDDSFVDRLVEHAKVRTHDEGVLLFREGGSADEFHLLVQGRVAIEMHSPGRGDLVLDTVEPCETVGWSWLVPPYRWFFTARALTEVTVVTVDAEALRALADDDPAFGYALMQRVTSVMLERMQAARVRLADLYGVVGT